jgi:DNA-damage-inducible protein J
MSYIVDIKTNNQENVQKVENSVVRARIDAETKAEASAVLASIGLALSDAVRLMLKRVAAEKALPFEPLVPNAETIEAIRAARRGELETANSVKNLIEDLA